MSIALDKNSILCYSITKMKLTLSPEIKRKVQEILAPLKNPEGWSKMGIPFAPNPYAVVRLAGGPGTGKTAMANYMATQMGKKPLRLEFGSTANNEFGATEDRITKKFLEASELEIPTIIMEEAESLLLSREQLDMKRDSHMLGIIDTMLVQIDRFIARKVPSLLIITTNLPELLDPAIESRITDVIQLFPPVGLQAWKLWESKLPNCMFGNLSDLILNEWFNKLCLLQATPRQMEQAILRICRKAMLEKREPRFEDFELPSI